MKNNFKKAFSLIEISIVILVVGILIAGISKGLDLVNDMRIATARALTDKAPMFGMENLELWLETTSENSLATGTASFTNVANPSDKKEIGRWNDLNPTLINPNNKNHAVQGTLAYQPLYIQDGINGLPALFFDGFNDFLVAGDGKTNFSEYTIFLVFYSQQKSLEKVNGQNVSDYSNLINVSCRGIVSCQYVSTSSNYQQISGGGNPIFWISTNNQNTALGYMQTKINVILPHSWISNAVNLLNNIARLAEVNFNNKTVTMSVNPKQINVVSSVPLANGNDYLDFRLGTQKGNGELSRNRNYKGYMGEIILFSRSLNDQETLLIKNYLSEKWRIKL